jgi:hypothetical protein
MDTQLETINKKLDIIIKLLQKKETNNEWSVDYYKNAILIKFPYNQLLKEHVKQLGGKWNVTLTGWIFSKTDEEKVIQNISENFKDYKFVDNREQTL